MSAGRPGRRLAGRRRPRPRVVLVTGASRGIGLAVARRYVADGTAVGLVAAHEDGVRRAAAELGGRTCAVAADLTRRDECLRAVAEVHDALGEIDVVVSAAGVLARAFAQDVTESDLVGEFRLHAAAPLWLAQGVLPAMRARRDGAIVVVSSELGIIGAPSYAAYCASKWAALGIAESLAHELVGSGVHVCAVCPGDVRTEQLAAEQAWGPTGGAPYAAAMSPDRVARAVVRAATGPGRLVIVDRLKERILFTLMAGPRRSRFGPVHGAFDDLLRSP